MNLHYWFRHVVCRNRCTLIMNDGRRRWKNGMSSLCLSMTVFMLVIQSLRILRYRSLTYNTIDSQYYAAPLKHLNKQHNKSMNSTRINCRWIKMWHSSGVDEHLDDSFVSPFFWIYYHDRWFSTVSNSWSIFINKNHVCIGSIVWPIHFFWCSFEFTFVAPVPPKFFHRFSIIHGFHSGLNIYTFKLFSPSCIWSFLSDISLQSWIIIITTRSNRCSVYFMFYRKTM